MMQQLASWTDGAAKAAIVEFVDRVVAPGGDDHVPPAGRVAVFDNDGTLWCEKPMPIQLHFTMRRLAEQAQADPALRERQPYKAAFEQDLHWLGAAMVKHHQGDDTDLLLLKGSVERAFEAISVPDYDRRVSGFFDDGPEKPVRIWSRIGRRPLLAFGNSNGDIPMLAFAGGPDRPALRLLLLHDDADREFDDRGGAEQALDRAAADGWTVVSIKHDWQGVFTGAPP
jgi:hypothetical protein